jgi:hypothetical protein
MPNRAKSLRQWKNMARWVDGSAVDERKTFALKPLSGFTNEMALADRVEA